MQVPHFPEANHPLVKSLFHHSDGELLTLFQRYPEAGKYFTAIFCRYSPIVYTLIRHSARSPVQAEYLFALTWQHIYYELGGLDLRANGTSDTEVPTLQHWLINVTAVCINQADLPPVESIHYSLQAASPPLWCYVQQALDRLPPMAMAFTVVMMAGVFQMIFGTLRLGKYVTMMPYTVISGFMSGIGIILVILQLAPFLGQASPKGGVVGTLQAIPDLLGNIQPAETMLAVITVAIIWFMGIANY